MELQTMSLRFRVWDKEEKRFVRWCGVDEFDLWLLGDWMDTINVVEFKEDYIISQDTGFEDKNSKSIFTMDLVKCWDEHIGQVYYDDALLEIRVKFDDGDDEDLASCEPEVVGNIWQDGERLLCPKE